jgi:2,4-dienoyl-CoA reductase-like NADH-dependent reductase (Old Yellow Enzyme family)/NAD(P)-dependent dehydrogenase (short-subunit alcohol dehydrogenase family)
MSAYSHLFTPLRIGTMTAKNRLLMSAMSINFGVDAAGRVNDQLVEYFTARARGGVGMMLVGGGAVHPTGLELPDLPKLWDDGCIPSLQAMVAAVRPYDCRFGVQLMHGGRQSYHDQKVAPSPIPAPAVVKGIPRELTPEQIQELVAAFGDAARRCREAGFDFIEIHAAHGYLINQFLAPNANRRTDAYGGSFENRTRFLMELFRDIRGKCGEDFPVGLRINGEDYIDNGWGLEEACRLAVLLERAGAAYLHVSAGVYGSRQLTIPSMYAPHGCFVHLAEAVKRCVSIPVAAVGRIKTPELAEEVIREGKADLVALGRALLADPEFPAKARRGAAAEIRPCIGCCLGCIHAVLALEPGGCVINPGVGREYLLKDEAAAPVPRKVLVVGAGPAGMAAARSAALRGHRVTICDRRPHSGGLLRLAAIPPGRGELADILDFFEADLRRRQVDLRLGTPVTGELIAALAPERALLATGSLPELPVIKGFSQTRLNVATVVEVLDGEVAPGERVLILGGGQAGLVLADHLACAGRRVVVLNRRRHFAEELSSNDRFYLRERLKGDRVTLHKGVAVREFLPRGVRFAVDGVESTLEGFDTLVVAEGMQAVREARRLLEAAGVPVELIGDAREPRSLMLAISEGEEAARSL